MRYTEHNKMEQDTALHSSDSSTSTNILQFFMSIDEAMITFRGRVGFQKYIRGKPQPWGIKAYVLSESKSGNMVMYYGKETQLITAPALNHTTKVVLTLISPLANMGYDLYTILQLATELLRIGTTLTGTVMVNKKDMPAATKSALKQKRRCLDILQRFHGCHSVDRQENSDHSLNQAYQCNGFHTSR